MSLPKQILPSGEKLPIECQVDHCLRCGKPVDPSTGQVLEHDLSIAEWHDFGMPKENSGSFDLFGKECVKVMRDRARRMLGDVQAMPRAEVLHLMRDRLQKKIAVETGAVLTHYEAMLAQVERQLERTDGANVEQPQ